MPRLPVPGSDDGVWGDLLNEFIEVAHEADGSLKASALSNYSLTSHTHSDYAPLSHTHSDYALTSHSHSDYALASHTHNYAPFVHSHSVQLSLAPFTVAGILTTGVGVARLPIDSTYTIVGVLVMVNSAPTGSGILVDVNKNGTTIFSTQGNRPSIANGAFAGGPGVTPDVTTLSIGDYLTIDIDQVGSSIAGSDLTVSIIVNKTVG